MHFPTDHIVPKQRQKIATKKRTNYCFYFIAFTVFSTIATTIATSTSIDIFGKEKGQTISSIVMSIGLVLFREMLPKIIIALPRAARIGLGTTLC